MAYFIKRGIGANYDEPKNQRDIMGVILFSCPADARRVYNITVELTSREKQYYRSMLEAIGMPATETNISLCFDLGEIATAIRS